MPKALQSDFCAQCGCTLHQVNIDGGKVFECGEIVYEAAGRFGTSYTCRTIPQLMRTVEGALESAVGIIAQSGLTPGARAALLRAHADPEYSCEVAAVVRDFLTGAGLAQRTKHTKGSVRLRLTYLGRLVARRLQAQMEHPL